MFGTFAGPGGAAPAAACVLDPQLNHVTIGQGLPYSRLVRGKETLVRFYLSLPASIPKCGSSSRSIRINSATLRVLNAGAPLTQTPIAAQPEAINAEVTNTAPTSRSPSIPVNSPADPKFVVNGGVLAPSGVTGTFTATFEATIRYASKGNDGVFTSERSRTFTSFTPPGGSSTPASRLVEVPTRNLRVLVVPMGGQLDTAASTAVGAGMSHLARLFPVPDGTPGARTAELTSTAGVLRYTVNSGVVNMTGLLDGTGKFCGTSTNFATIQAQLQGFRNAWNGVVNGVDSPQEQDADKVVGVVPESSSYPSTSTSPSGCLEGFAMTNSNESWIRAVSNMAGPLFAMEICHTFGCVADTGTFHSLYTAADNQDPDRAYNVLDRAFIQNDRTAMRLILPWSHENTVMEKDHFAYLLCGFGGASTNGCPAAPATGTLTGVAATTGSAFAMYGTVNRDTNVATVNSMDSTGAPLTVPDNASEWRLVQRNSGGVVGPSNGYGIPVRFTVSHHGAGADHHHDPLGSFNVAFPAEPTATTIELRRNGVAMPLYTRSANNAPTITDVSAGGDVIPLAVWKSAAKAGPTSGPISRPKPKSRRKAAHRAGNTSAPSAAPISLPSSSFSAIRVLALSSMAQQATVFTVNSTADPGAGDCNATECTLREAIDAANANAGTDTIEFNIGAGGGQTIQPTSALPSITEAVLIDGKTQPVGDGGGTYIELDGTNAGAGANGLLLSAAGITIRGLVINRFGQAGVQMQSTNGRLEGNYIGTDPTGMLDEGNASRGVWVFGSNNVIGGTTAAARNLISGNGFSGISDEAASTTIQGNWIGLNAAGTGAIGNCFGGIREGGSNALIGGTAAGAGNVISGNGGCAVFGWAQIAMYQNSGPATVQGNLIGTNAAGTAVLADGADLGVRIMGTDNNLIGGTTAAAANVITGPSTAVDVGNYSGNLATGNTVQGNYIGTNAAGADLGAGGGGVILTASGNTIGGTDGGGNTIAHNNNGGVLAISGTQNQLVGNSIFDNTNLGIDLGGDGLTSNDEGDGDSGANNLQNFPVVQTATSSDSGTVVTGDLDGDVPTGSYRLEFFYNSVCDVNLHGEGQSFLGAATIGSDGSGNIVFEESFPIEVPTGQFVTATATDPNGNTSEFSQCRLVAGTGGGDPATFTVNSANDADDGACTILHCSLREAINAANTTPTAQTISFAIGTGTQTIQPTSPLPTITDGVTIDGTTQPGFAGSPIIEIAGNMTLEGTVGLHAAAGPTTIRGLVINRFPAPGILVASEGAADVTISGNYIGTNVAGNADLGNAGDGIRVQENNATIGGTTAATRNVVSGNGGHGIFLYNSTGSTVQGNYAGTNAGGTAAIRNGIDGIAVDGGANNTIGGTAAGAGNVASGNTNQGIAIFGVDFPSTSGNIVQGNTVGMDALREEAVANGGDGVRLLNASNSTVGGPATGANLIAYNGSAGVSISTEEGTAVNNSVRRNEIHSNTELGIDISNNGVTANDFGSSEPFVPPDTDTGPNNQQNFPVIRSASGATVSGDLRSTPSTTFNIDFYSNAECDPSESGEGERYIGSTMTTTNASGSATFTFTTEPALVPGEWITATATDPNGNTSEFSACRRAREAGAEGTTPVDIQGTDENPENVRTFVFADCGARQEPIIVDRPPSDTSGNNYFVSFDFDPKPACAGPDGQLVLTVVTTDGFRTSAPATVTVQSSNEAPSPSIATDGPFMQFDGITLHGSAFDADQTIPGTALTWSSTLFSGTRPGFAVNLGRPNNGWTPGPHPVTLTATDGELTSSVTKTITIVGDADHDGCPTGKDLNDGNKYDAYTDNDNDGRYNCEDAQPNVPDTSFTGTATFTPDPLVLPYNGVVTMTMRLLNKNVADVQPSSVELKSIDGQNVSGDPAFKATSVAVTNTGILRATFSGPNISNWLMARNVRDRRILVTMGGVSRTTPQWSFEATGSTFVRQG